MNDLVKCPSCGEVMTDWDWQTHDETKCKKEKSTAEKYLDKIKEQKKEK